MNTTAGFRSNITSSMITSHISSVTMPTNDTKLPNNTSRASAATDKGECGDSGVIAAYVTVPILILAGVLTVLIFIIKRKKSRNKNGNGSDCAESKMEKKKNSDIGLDNGAFSHEYQNGKREHSSDSIGQSTYEIINNKNSIYYENENSDIKTSESVYYDFGNKNGKDDDITEDEYGYGQFKKDSNLYQNVTKQADQNNMREIESSSTVENKSNIGYDSEPVYMNDADMVSVANMEKENEALSKKPAVEESDPLYDHAQAGGHEWDNKQTFRTETMINDTDDLESIYMNDTNNISPDTDERSKFGIKEISIKASKIPVYLELEPEIDENEVYENLGNAEANVDKPYTSDMYDYASSDDIGKHIIEDVRRVTDIPTETADDSNSVRLYLNVEEEETCRKDGEESDYYPASNHEYFILEKVD